MKVPTKLRHLIVSTTNDKELVDLLINKGCLSESALSKLNEVLEQIAFKRSSWLSQEKIRAEEKAKDQRPLSWTDENGDEHLRDAVRLGGPNDEFAWIEHMLLLNSWLSPHGIGLSQEPQATD